MEFTTGMLAAVVVAILVGAVLQRLSGSGMGLVLAPTLTLIMEPHTACCCRTRRRPSPASC